jgi:hypothetical protein
MDQFRELEAQEAYGRILFVPLSKIIDQSLSLCGLSKRVFHGHGIIIIIVSVGILHPSI